MIRRTLLVIASTTALAALPLTHRVMAEPTKAPASTTQETTVPTTNTVPTAPATDAKPTTDAKPEPTPAAVSDILKSLDLTPEQKPQVDKIQEIAAAQIKGVLSPEQLKQLKVLSEKGTADSEAFKSLNLTPEQKTKLNDVQMDVAAQLFAVLTPAQRDKLIESMMARTKTQ
jgi:Spy/CpxP family protein refolding chaperone